MRKLRPVPNLPQGSLVTMLRHGLRHSCNGVGNIEEKRTHSRESGYPKSKCSRMPFALLSPSLIKLFMHKYACINVFLQVEGWNAARTIACEQWDGKCIKLQVAVVAMCLLLLVGVPLLVQLCVCRNTLLIFHMW